MRPGHRRPVSAGNRRPGPQPLPAGAGLQRGLLHEGGRPGAPGRRDRGGGNGEEHVHFRGGNARNPGGGGGGPVGVGDGAGRGRAEDGRLPGLREGRAAACRKAQGALPVLRAPGLREGDPGGDGGDAARRYRRGHGQDRPLPLGFPRGPYGAGSLAARHPDRTRQEKPPVGPSRGGDRDGAPRCLRPLRGPGVAARDAGLRRQGRGLFRSGGLPLGGLPSRGSPARGGHRLRGQGRRRGGRRTAGCPPPLRRDCAAL